MDFLVDFVETKMGVQSFWQLIESTSRPVNMNKGLEGKVLAIGKRIDLPTSAHDSLSLSLGQI